MSGVGIDRRKPSVDLGKAPLDGEDAVIVRSAKCAEEALREVDVGRLGTRRAGVGTDCVERYSGIGVCLGCVESRTQTSALPAVVVGVCSVICRDTYDPELLSAALFTTTLLRADRDDECAVRVDRSA